MSKDPKNSPVSRETRKLKFPKNFPSSSELRELLNNHYETKLNRVRQITLEKLINDKNMCLVGFPALRKIKKVTIPKSSSKQPVSKNPIYLFLCASIEIYQNSHTFHPMDKKDYIAAFTKIAKSSDSLITEIRGLKKAGAYYAESIRESFIDYLENLSSLAKRAAGEHPFYVRGNFMMMGSRKKIDPQRYFITYLWLECTNLLFDSPLYDCIAIAANTLFTEKKEVTADGVKKIISRFKKQHNITG